MNQQHPYSVIIPPVPDGVHRPLWSVMIPTHNCANYLRETLASVLAQDPGSEVMQIEVIDDYSTKDDPAAVVEELGQGRVSFYRQPHNVGHTKNFQTCLERARGKLIHLLHGDDYVRNGFYQKLQQAFEENPEIGAAFCRHMGMDEYGHWLWISDLEQPKSGILNHWLERIAVRQRIQTPSMVVRRDVYEAIGMFDSRLSWSEDWEMWVRIAVNYPVWYEVEPLAAYRIHTNSNSGRYIRTGEDIRDLRRAIAIIQSYLPSTVAKQLSQTARENWALYAIRYTAPKLLAQDDLNAAMIQVREAMKCSQSLQIIKESTRLILQIKNLKIKNLINRRKQNTGNQLEPLISDQGK